jgi:acylphosphatase
VQGVGFRYFAFREATALGLTGWVRNLPDGRVEVQASGSEAELVHLLTALHRGPRHSAVSGVDEVEISDEGREVKSFDVR